MPLPKRRTQYEDVERVLESVYLAGKPGHFECASHKAAVHWRQRAYYLRTLMAKDGETKYDKLRLTIEARSNIVQIGFPEPAGVLKIEDEVVQVQKTKVEREVVADRVAADIDKIIEAEGLNLDLLDKM